MSEAALLRDIRQALNATKRVRVVRNTVGFDVEHRAKYGLGEGSPDLIGVLRGGRAFGCEVKTPVGRLSRAQRAWWRAARAWGITGGTARSVDEAIKLLEEAERS